MKKSFLTGPFLGVVLVAVTSYCAAPALASDVGFFINRGVQKQRNKDHNGAIADFNQSIRIRPAWEAYFNRAVSELALGQKDAALSDLFEALKFNPDDPEAYYQTGVLLLDPAFRTKGENAKLAERYMNISIKSGFRLSYSYTFRALARYTQQKYPGAQSDATEAIRLDPAFADAWHIRGNSKAKMQDYASAIADLQKAYSINPKKPDFVIALIETKTAQKDFSGAVELADRILKSEPNNAVCLQMRGFAKEKSGDKNGALADYAKAIAADPRYSDARWARGELRSSLNDFDGAIQDFNESIRILNDAPVASLSYYGRGYARYKQGDYAKAIQDFAKADSLANMEEQFYAIFGEILVNQKQSVDALKYLEKAVSMNPNVGPTQFNLGLTQYRLGRFGAAAQAYERAAALGQTPYVSSLNAGNCLRRQGQFEEALRILNKAKSSSNNDSGLEKKLETYISMSQQRDSGACEWEENTAAGTSSKNANSDFKPTGTETNINRVAQRLGGTYLTAAELRNGTVARAKVEIVETFPQTFQMHWFFNSSRKIFGNGIKYGDKFVVASMDRAVLWVGLYRQDASQIVGATTNTNYARGVVLTEVLSRSRPSENLPRLPAADRDISGTYKVEGRYGPHKYEGELTFERDGQTYNAHWRTKEGMHLQGIALVSGNDIGVCYRTVGFAAPVMYSIRSDGNLDGLGTPNGRRINLEVGVKIK